jgi:ribonuclease HI
MDQQTSKITLFWVPSHVGIPGNETADATAKEALDEEIQQYEKYSPQDLIKWIKTYIRTTRKMGKITLHNERA